MLIWRLRRTILFYFPTGGKCRYRVPLRLAPDGDPRGGGHLLQELSPRHQLRRAQSSQDQGPRLLPRTSRIVQPGSGTCWGKFIFSYKILSVLT